MINLPLYRGSRLLLNSGSAGILLDHMYDYYSNKGFHDETYNKDYSITGMDITYVISEAGADDPIPSPAPAPTPTPIITPVEPTPTENPIYLLEVNNLPGYVGEWIVNNSDQVRARIQQTASYFGWSVAMSYFDAGTFGIYLEKQGSATLAIVALAIIAVVVSIIAIVGYKISFNWRLVEVERNQTIQQESVAQETGLNILKQMRDQILAAGGDVAEIDQAILKLTSELPTPGIPTTPIGAGLGDLTKMLPYAIGAMVLIAVLKK